MNGFGTTVTLASFSSPGIVIRLIRHSPLHLAFFIPLRAHFIEAKLE